MIAQIIHAYGDLLKTAPLMGSALGIWVGGITTFLMRNLPSKIMAFIKSQLTVTIDLDNMDKGDNKQNFDSLLLWLEQQSFYNRVRRFRLFPKNFNVKKMENMAGMLGTGSTSHYFFYKRKLYHFHMYVDKQSNQGKDIKDGGETKVCITYFGRNQKHLRELVNDFRKKIDRQKAYIYKYSQKDSYYNYVATVPKRTLASVVTAESTKKEILNAINTFLESEEEYVEKGIPWKLVLLLYGVPGTGKTSFIRSLAHEINKSIYIVDMTSVTNDGFVDALLSSRGIAVMEDIDNVPATKPRKDIIGQKTDNTTSNDEKNDQDKFIPLTLDGILNAMDGIAPLHGQIIIMTSNSLNIDPALIREGRTDHIIEIKEWTNQEVRDYIHLMFPDVTIDPDIVFPNMPGCVGQAKYFKYKNEPEKFIQELANHKVSNTNNGKIMNSKE